MNLNDILNGYRPYDGIVKNFAKTPISVSGVVESAQVQLISALANYRKRNALVVTYSEMEARKLVSDLRVYTDNVTIFPSKEYVFYDILNCSIHIYFSSSFSFSSSS